MKRLEVSGAVRPIYGSLGVKRLIYFNAFEKEGIILNVRNRLPEEEEPLLRPRHKWKDNIKMYLKEKGLWKIRVCTDCFRRWSSDFI